MKPIGAKLENLEKSLKCNRCQQKFKSVNSRKVHEARYCGKLKARVDINFSNSVKKASGTEFESVHAFKNLGTYFSLQDGDAKGIVCKLAEGRHCVSNFWNIWKKIHFATTVKCKLYRAFILSAVLYSSEKWTINKALEKNLIAFAINCLRRILCFFYMTKIINQSVLNKTQMAAISKIIMIRRLKWFGHVQRIESDRLPRRAFEWNPTDNYPNTVKSVGRQRKTLVDQLQKNCKKTR